MPKNRHALNSSTAKLLGNIFTKAITNENTVKGMASNIGRGLVRLTWVVNYRKAERYFNINFVHIP